MFSQFVECFGGLTVIEVNRLEVSADSSQGDADAIPTVFVPAGEPRLSAFVLGW